MMDKATAPPNKARPKHIAIIMDGNGRWAEQRDQPRTYGHQQAVQAVEDVIEGCIEMEIEYLTLYAFSIENRQRPEKEVAKLMQLYLETLLRGVQRFIERGVSLHWLGDPDMLPSAVVEATTWARQETKKGQGLNLCVALNYSGRWEIAEACRQIAKQVKEGTLAPEAIDEQCVANHLQTRGMPEPELLIRTGGEQRVSNFLLWQIAYTELYLIDTMWPDFRKEHLQQAVYAYQHRERRFGKISAQIHG